MNGPSVLIVGAGIAGLTTAIALAGRGVAVEVVERASDFAPAGAGITLQPNATAVLAALGVALDPADVLPMGEVAMVDARGRPLLQGAPDSEVSPSVNIRRMDLHRALLAASGRERVRFGAGVIALDDEGDAVRARLADGSEGRWDLVIGADGVHSQVRRAILPTAACEPRYTGQTCWRLLVEAPDLAPRVSVERWTPGRRIGVIPLSRGGIYVYLVQSAPCGSVAPGSDSVAHLRRLFAGADDRLDAILDRAAGEPGMHIHHGDLIDLPVYSTGRGRVLLVGDAAHAMTPNLGQGAAMAIEDAAALALLWPRDRGALAGLADALAAERRARVEELHRVSWRIGQVAHWQRPAARWLRDRLLRAMPASVVMQGVHKTWAPGLELAGRLRSRTDRGEVA